MLILPAFSMFVRLVLSTVLACHTAAIYGQPLSLTQPISASASGSLRRTAALPITKSTACTNMLHNPSFEANNIEPWKSYAFGSWAARNVCQGAAHSGSHYYCGISNSTSASTVTLSQTNINMPSGTKVECSTWVHAGGNMGTRGTASYEMFLDGTSCGSTIISAADAGNRWLKIGKDVSTSGNIHSLAIVIVADARGEMGTGIEVGIDDVSIGECG